jgi:hypothetical protein
VKSQKSSSLIANLEDTFNNLTQFNIKLNPEKCTIRLPQGKLLGCIITEHGIEANPDKISAVAEVGQAKNIKDVQRLMGCLTALCHFVSQLG